MPQVNSIKKKIIITFCLIIAVSLIISGTVAFFYCFNLLRSQFLNDEAVELNRTARQFTYITTDIRNYALNIIMDNNIQDYLKSGSADYIERSIIMQRIGDQLSKLVVQRDYMLDILLIKGEDIIVSKAQLGLYLDAEYFKGRLREPWYTANSARTGSFFATPYQLPAQQSTIETLPYIINIKDISNPHKTIGQMILNINYEYLIKNIIGDNIENDDYFWLDSRNGCLYRKNPGNAMFDTAALQTLVGKTRVGKIGSYRTSQGYVLVDKTMDNGWVLASFIFANRIFKKTQSIIYFFLFYTLVILASTFAIMMPIVSGIIRPLSNLTNAMKRVSNGNLDETIVVESDDELGVLARGFNNMLENLKDYIRKTIEFEKEKKKIEFNFLLAQINPHFIYNTLHTVIYMANRTKNHDIVSMTKSFIAVLQDAVKINEEGLVTPLGQEIEVVRQYINIQKYRYKDRFEVIWEIDESLLGYEVPRTILQPIVENCLLHGLLPTQRQGVITVAVGSSGADILISVADNGVGMSREMIERILNGREEAERSDKMRSIGIHNVQERIKYICGASYGLMIESEENRFTRFLITLPKLKDAERSAV